MRPPCEKVFKDALPTIRALLVKDLTDRHGLNQVEVAKRLGITQPAVSQYLRSLRGASYTKALLKRSNVMGSLRNLSNVIASGKARETQIAEMYCEICRVLRE